MSGGHPELAHHPLQCVQVVASDPAELAGHMLPQRRLNIQVTKTLSFSG
jgi:hypothetical protein